MNGQRGIFEKLAGSGVWWVQYFDADGRRRREKIGSKSNAIKLAEKRRTERLVGKKLPENLRTPPVSFAELAEAALVYSAKKKLSYRDDKVRMAKLEAQFGRCAAEEITRQEIQDWLDSHQWSLATKNRYLALLKLTYRLAEEKGQVKINPVRLMHQAKENNVCTRFLTANEEAVFRAVLGKYYEEHLPEFEIALHTGLRRSEQYGLTWERVDLENRIVTVPRAKNGEMRHVKLNTHVLAVFKELHSRSLGVGPVFQTQDPRYWFESAVELAGLKNFTWHSIRHTFASRLVMKGADIRAVQEAMGHKTIGMTMRYAHLSPEHQFATVEKLCEKPTATTTATAVRRVENGPAVSIN